MEDIRWEQRFENYLKALEKLKQSIDYIKHDFEAKKDTLENNKEEVVLSEIVKEGLIQRFEYTHELAWNVMKDYAEYQGNFTVGGSRDASREAFQLNLITDGHLWMDMISSRNKTSHTYNEATANEIFEKIVEKYYPAFLEFKKVMEAKKESNQ